jgi:hypothetical protein
MKGTDTIHTEDPAATSRRQLSYNTTIKVKMTMNQYPLYLRIETKRNLFLKIESITIHKKSTQISKTVW